ncbi:YcxB family protein [Mucilaginibacter lappiensis]|uniref:YcxB-like protein n=1 Tax=Mucilaginibacter lappiensis TaxID=354630 RepID=A0A841JAD8_9SPHI|nr:YcxB family protein [Mucilaginibacter lappiensis]MBB6128063.1 hypothetical protein [Mucilaginibacter lappiensis]
MIITLVLNENDYLTQQLYVASTSKRSRRNRRKSWLIVSIGFVVLGLCFTGSNEFYNYYFLGMGVLSFIFYPYYQRYKYRRHYQKNVSEMLQYRIGKPCEVNFLPDFILTKDVTGEGKMNTSEITEINEISSHYFIRTKSGETLIIPKAQIHSPSFVTDLVAIFKNPNIMINKQLDWKWK